MPDRDSIRALVASAGDTHDGIEAATDAILAALADRAQPDAGWRDISTAPDLERVMVAGWQKPNGRTAGYWWYHEDACHEGRAIEHPHATLWCPLNLPAFPVAPTSTGEAGHE